jgi:hypothetical protein
MSLTKTKKSTKKETSDIVMLPNQIKQKRRAAYDHEYIDVYAINANSITALPIPVRFTQTRNMPFLYKPEDYYLSVVRFQIDTNTLPVFTCAIQYNQPQINLSIYSVTLSWTNPVAPFQTFNQQTFITWIPQDLASPIPRPPSLTENKFQDNSGGYYYCYNYSYVLQIINNAFSTCFLALNAQVVFAGLALPTFAAPVLTWNNDNNISVLNADILGYDQTTLNYIKIYMNLPLYQLFNTLPAYIEPFPALLGKNYRIDTDNFGNAQVTPFPFYLPTYNALQIFQEQPSINVWSPISSIVFTSNTLPINSTNVCNPSIFLDGVTTNNNGNNSNIEQVITDFQAENNLYKNSCLYIPSGENRYVDLMGNTPLYSIDINIYWRDKIGTLYPFRLATGCCASIKVLFERKELITGIEEV